MGAKLLVAKAGGHLMAVIRVPFEFFNGIAGKEDLPPVERHLAHWASRPFYWMHCCLFAVVYAIQKQAIDRMAAKNRTAQTPAPKK